MIKQYRKKPVLISAVRWDGNINTRNFLTDWLGDSFITDGDYERPAIKTLEGTMRVNLGDYIIQGVQGEFYPCKPDIFKATYEEVVVTAESIAESRGYLKNTTKAATYTATVGNSTAKQDIAATRRFVGNDVEVIGGGEENGHFTGVR
jgi:hypothetical protein